MKKITIYLLLFFIFSCVSSDRPRSPSSFSWGDKDFSIDLEKGYSTLDMCPLKLTLKNKYNDYFDKIMNLIGNLGINYQSINDFLIENKK